MADEKKVRECIENGNYGIERASFIIETVSASVATWPATARLQQEIGAQAACDAAEAAWEELCRRFPEEGEVPNSVISVSGDHDSEIPF